MAVVHGRLNALSCLLKPYVFVQMLPSVQDDVFFEERGLLKSIMRVIHAPFIGRLVYRNRSYAPPYESALLCGTDSGRRIDGIVGIQIEESMQRMI